MPIWRGALIVGLGAAQGMAGNIIHAIATTNAIISGLIAVQALKILAGCSHLCAVRPACPYPPPPRKFITHERIRRERALPCLT